MIVAAPNYFFRFHGHSLKIQVTQTCLKIAIMTPMTMMAKNWEHIGELFEQASPWTDNSNLPPVYFFLVNQRKMARYNPQIQGTQFIASPRKQNDLTSGLFGHSSFHLAGDG